MARMVPQFIRIRVSRSPPQDLPWPRLEAVRALLDAARNKRW